MGTDYVVVMGDINVVIGEGRDGIKIWVWAGNEKWEGRKIVSFAGPLS